jgi:hypothetical protein
MVKFSLPEKMLLVNQATGELCSPLEFVEINFSTRTNSFGPDAIAIKEVPRKQPWGTLITKEKTPVWACTTWEEADEVSQEIINKNLQLP